MGRRTTTVGLLLLVLGAAGVTLALAPSVGAVTDPCSYDGATRTLTFDMRVLPVDSFGHVAAWLVRESPAPDSRITWLSTPSGSSGPCSSATYANTSAIHVLGGPESDAFQIVQRVVNSGPDAPFTGVSFTVDLGGQGAGACANGDSIYVTGTYLSANTMAVGTAGISFENRNLADVTIPSPVSCIVLYGGKKNDVLSGLGGFGAGAPTSVALNLFGMGGAADQLTGSSGDDLIYGKGTLQGGGGNDGLKGGGTLDGGSGNDSLTGTGGNETMIGGPGADVISAKGGNDTIYARDGVKDTKIDGGPGTDSAQIDTGLDTTVNVENLLP